MGGRGEKLGFLFLKFNKGNTIVQARLGTLLNFKFRSFVRSIRKQIPYQKTNIKEQKTESRKQKDRGRTEKKRRRKERSKQANTAY